MRTQTRITYLAAILLIALNSHGQLGHYQGVCTNGAGAAVVSGTSSSNDLFTVYPSCTVTVSQHGVPGVVTIYSDAAGTMPITSLVAAATGFYDFYVSPAVQYDIQMNFGGTPPNFTLSNVTISPGPAAGVSNALSQATTNLTVPLANSAPLTTAPTFPVNAGTVSPLSGVTEPTTYIGSNAGVRQLESYSDKVQSTTSPTSGDAFVNAQIDWFLNRSAGPPVYAVGPLYNWNGAGTATNPTFWTDREGPTGLTGAGFLNWGPATRSAYLNCLTLTSPSSSTWPYCHYMANIYSTATGSLHVGHFNPGLQSFVGQTTPQPTTGTQAGTSSPVDSFTYAYTDVPYGKVQNLAGLEVNLSYLTGGQNYASRSEVGSTNLQNVNALAIDLEVPTAAQGGGTFNLTSNHYAIGDNFLHADRGICNGVSSNLDQGCGLLIGGLGESTGVFYSQVSHSVTDPQYPQTSPLPSYGGDGRTTLQLTSPPVDVLPGDSLLTIDYSAPYTDGNLQTFFQTALAPTPPAPPTYPLVYTSCTVAGESTSCCTVAGGSSSPSCSAYANTSGVFGVKATTTSTDANWVTQFGGSNASTTTFISAPMPSNHQQNPAVGTACAVGATFDPSQCGCGLVDSNGDGGTTYGGISPNSPNTYPSGPMCIQVSSTTGFTAGQSIRIADQTCVDDTQIVYPEPYQPASESSPAVPAHLIIASARCQHASGEGADIVASGKASGLALAAGNDTWASADTGNDPVEVWMPVVYSDSSGYLYVWQDSNKYAAGNFYYRGRAYYDTTKDTAPDSSCIGSIAVSPTAPYGLQDVAYSSSASCGGSYPTGDAFNTLTVSGCTGKPSIYFAPSSTSANSVGSIVIADPGTECNTGTVTIAIGQVPNPYQLAPAVMTTSVYEPNVSAFSTAAPYGY